MAPRKRGFTVNELIKFLQEEFDGDELVIFPGYEREWGKCTRDSFISAVFDPQKLSVITEEDKEFNETEINAIVIYPDAEFGNKVDE